MVEQQLKDLSFALMIGVIVGTYSSLFIATPLLIDLSKGAMKDDQRKMAEKAAAIEAAAAEKAAIDGAS